MFLAVETEEEAEQILQQLLLTDKPTRRPRKQEPVEFVENIEVAFVNEGYGIKFMLLN